ncbi:hypothetical protein EVAR_75522_1 [Eumeta japonica]|uniref:Uncharacterized protein n=1 Tax=Eumeta variegata TaxID=151549 RepID=A0A4C1UJP1_EUMVA|nr:hypothetical protein EVAR_75522_1 [Eumeta japonica]
MVVVGFLPSIAYTKSGSVGAMIERRRMSVARSLSHGSYVCSFAQRLQRCIFSIEIETIRHLFRTADVVAGDVRSRSRPVAATSSRYSGKNSEPRLTRGHEPEISGFVSDRGRIDSCILNLNEIRTARAVSSSTVSSLRFVLSHREGLTVQALQSEDEHSETCDRRRACLELQFCIVFSKGKRACEPSELVVIAAYGHS